MGIRIPVCDLYSLPPLYSLHPPLTLTVTLRCSVLQCAESSPFPKRDPLSTPGAKENSTTETPITQSAPPDPKPTPSAEPTAAPEELTESTPDQFETIRDLDEQERWCDRNTVITALEHSENSSLVSGLVEELVASLPVW